MAVGVAVMVPSQTHNRVFPCSGLRRLLVYLPECQGLIAEMTQVEISTFGPHREGTVVHYGMSAIPSMQAYRENDRTSSDCWGGSGSRLSVSPYRPLASISRETARSASLAVRA